jgi:hypothetical protein
MEVVLTNNNHSINDNNIIYNIELPLELQTQTADHQTMLRFDQGKKDAFAT